MEDIIAELKAAGADLVVEIDPSTVATAPWPVMKCRYGCPNYGVNACCPPAAPWWKETAEILACYHRALLFRVHDIAAGTPAAVGAVSALFKRGYYKALAFGTGPCRRCAKCLGTGRCPEPWLTAPSMEACGIDVFATVAANGIEPKTYTAPGTQPDCYGLVLVD